MTETLILTVDINNDIRKNDPLRDKKIKALTSLKGYLEGIDKDIRKHHFEKLIENYTSEWRNDKEMHELINDSTIYDASFWWNFPRKIAGSNSEENIKKIHNVIMKATLKYGPKLTEAIRELREKNRDICEWDIRQETSVSLNQKLARFEQRYPYAESNGSEWNKVLAREILKHKLWWNKADKIKTERAEQEQIRVTKSKTNNHQGIAKQILEEIREAEFRAELFGEKNMVCWSNRTQSNGTKHHTISEWEQITKNSIERLDDSLLETGKKKSDLLRELKETIQSKAQFLNNNDNVKGESQDQGSNQNQGNEENNTLLISEENIKPESSQEEELVKMKKAVVKRYIEETKKEPLVKSEELPAETRNLISQIADAKDVNHLLYIQSIFTSDFNIIRSRRLRGAELEETTQKFQNGQVDNNDFVNAFTKMNDSLGEEDNKDKQQELRKVMIQSDPEQFFSSFVQWVKEEEEKLEKIKQELAEEKKKTDESEWDSEEEKFLKGEITDQQQREEIAERIEVKIKTKKESWSWKKWIKEWTKWLKSKARLLRKSNKVDFEKQAAEIRQEIKNRESSSNLYTQQAYQNNREQTQTLLRELDNISQGNQTVASNEKGFFRPEIIIPLSVSMVVLAIVATVVIRKRKLAKVKK